MVVFLYNLYIFLWIYFYIIYNQVLFGYKVLFLGIDTFLLWIAAIVFYRGCTIQMNREVLIAQNAQSGLTVMDQGFFNCEVKISDGV